MDEKIAYKQINADIPEALATDLDEFCDRMGFVKKRAVAAALSAFIHSDIETQHSMYRDVYIRYWMHRGTLPDEAENAEQVILEEAAKAQKSGKKKARKGA